MRNDIAGFIDERHPRIHLVGKRNGVEVSTGQAVAVASVGGIGADCSVLRVEYPSRVMTFGIGMEDAREREAQLCVSPLSTAGLKDGRLDSTALAVDGCGRLADTRHCCAS